MLTLGTRAALELQLQDAKRDLQALIEEKNGYLAQADVFSALACEPGRGTVSNNCKAARLRFLAFGLGGQIAMLRQSIADLESRLNPSHAQAGPVVLPRDAVEGMDDMGGLLGVAA